MLEKAWKMSNNAEKHKFYIICLDYFIKLYYFIAVLMPDVLV